MNLLPKKEKDNLKKGLKNRLIIYLLFLLSASFLVGFATILPSYFLIVGNLSGAVQDTEPLKNKDEKNIKEVLNLPNEINSELKLMQTNMNKAGISDLISKIIQYSPSSVKLNSISFGRDQTYQEKSGTIIIVSGVSSDRDSLVLFSTRLKDSGLFSLVEVPVSSLTKDRDLPFSMNIFIAN